MRWKLMTSVLICGISLGMNAPAEAAGVHVALTSAATVAPGSDFEVHIVVPQAGDAFNAYETTISFDPSALTFLVRTPLTLQEGEYMTSACGTTFHWFEENAASVHIAHSLWCAGVLINGPGELYVLRFRAANVPQTTQVVISTMQFVAAGYGVPTASIQNATITIGGTTDVAVHPGKMQVLVAPNPFNPMTVIDLDVPTSGSQSVVIHDVSGRLIRTLDRGDRAAGTRRITWDGRDDHGNRLASGTYLVTIEASDQRLTKRVVLVR